MQHKHCFKAVDQTLRDVWSESELPFGGIPVLLGGDCVQILPVVKKGTWAAMVSASLQKSYL